MVGNAKGYLRTSSFDQDESATVKLVELIAMDRRIGAAPIRSGAVEMSRCSPQTALLSLQVLHELNQEKRER